MKTGFFIFHKVCSMFAQQTTIISEVTSSPAPKRSNDNDHLRIVSSSPTTMEMKMDNDFPKMGKVFPKMLNDAFGAGPEALRSAAIAANVTPKTVDNWFNGTCEPSGSKLLSLCVNSQRFRLVWAQTTGDTVLANATQNAAIVDTVRNALSMGGEA